MDQEAYDALWKQLRWDLGRLKSLASAGERGNPDTAQQFYELKGAMQVKLALVKGMISRGKRGGA